MVSELGDHWLAIIVAMVAAIPGVLAYINQRKSAKAEAARAKTNNAVKVTGEVWKISEEYKSRVKSLEEKIEELKENVDSLLAGIRLLLEQLESHDIIPVWTPDK